MDTLQTPAERGNAVRGTAVRYLSLLAASVTLLALSGCSVSPLNALTDDQRGELRDDASMYQQLVLSDLYVDETEYRQSVDDWHDCVTSAGADASEIGQRGNQLSFDYSIEAPTDAMLATTQTAADACLPEFYDAIGRVWVSQGTKLT